MVPPFSLFLVWEVSLHHLLHCPNPAGTDAGADAAADTDVIVGNILERSVGLFQPTDRPLGAGLQAH